MHSEDRFEFDARENGFFAQLPSVLIAASAIALIVFVNAGTGSPSGAPIVPGEAGRSAAPAIDAGQPDARAGNRAAARATLVPPAAARSV
jgi:hypothetical protein